MNDILIVPDIHGRDFWKEPCRNWQGSIVFLGDYHDPYGNYVINEPNKEESLQNFKELVTFVLEYRKTNSVICLLGNHDYYYTVGKQGCRTDLEHKTEVLSLLNDLHPQLYYELIYDVNNVTNKFLFSHAGITKNWLEVHNLTLETLNCKSINNHLEDIPYSRGGYAKYGSCIWNSLNDYVVEDHLPEYYQIFGHTWAGRTTPVIKKDYAMLDCCKAFILNLETKDIKEWTK